jgi:hypothetical protein
MDSLHRKCKETSIDRSKTFGCLMLAYLKKQASISAQLLASPFAPSCLFALLPFIYACLYP